MGGKPASSHLKGLAVDIACSASRDRFNLVNLFAKYGITRIGIAKNFIHIDIDGDKDPDVIWTY